MYNLVPPCNGKVIIKQKVGEQALFRLQSNLFLFFCFLCPSYRSPSHLFFQSFPARAVQGLKWMMKRLSRGSGSAASHTDASLVGMPRETCPPRWKVAGSLEPELQREKAHSLIYLTTFYVPVCFLPLSISPFFLSFFTLNVFLKGIVHPEMKIWS